MEYVFFSLAGISAGISAVSAIQGGREQEAQLEHQAEVVKANATQAQIDAEGNREINEYNRQVAVADADTQRQLIDKKRKITKATTAARFSRRGVDIGNGGSFDAIMTGIDNNYLLEQQNTMSMAGRSSSESFFTDAKLQREGELALQLGQYESSNLNYMAGRAKNTSYWNAAGAIASGAADMASFSANYNKEG